MSKAPKRPRPDEVTAGDVVAGIVKAGVAGIPVVGNLGLELYQLLIGGPADKRRAQWMDGIAEDIAVLQERIEGFRASDLAQDPEFVSTLMAASRMAVQTHQAEKLEALRNAVARAALGEFPDYNERAMFLHIVDGLTAQHLAVLRLLASPRSVPGAVDRYQDRMTSNLPQFIGEAIADLRGQNDMIQLLCSDLGSRGLLTTGANGIGGMMSGSGVLQKRTTEFGDRLLAFIETPAELLNS